MALAEALSLLPTPSDQKQTEVNSQPLTLTLRGGTYEVSDKVGAGKISGDSCPLYIRRHRSRNFITN